MNEKKVIKIDKHFLSTQNFPFISKPTTICEYSVDRQRNVELGRMKARTLYDSPLRSRNDTINYNLDIGYDTFDPKAKGEKLEVLLQWIEKVAPNGGRLKKAINEADVVCWRGLLTRIGLTVYENEEKWRFRAVRHKNVIFLCEEETEDRIKRENEMTEREKHMSYWGFKFEQYMTCNDDQDLPNIDEAVSTKEEFAAVVRTSIQNSSEKREKETIELLYSAEVDCLDRNGKLVELKTHKGDLKGWFWTGTKSLKWWLQSFLVAIEQIVVGHRNEGGFVKKVSSIRVDKIQKESNWYGGACIRFISIVLSNVYETLELDGQACLVEFNGSIQQGVEIQKVKSDTCDFVPESFLNKFH